MRTRFPRFLARWGLRAAFLVVIFGAGWAGYVWSHPKPLLQDRWEQLVQAAGSGAAGARTTAAKTGENSVSPSSKTPIPPFSAADFLAMRDPIGQSEALLEYLKTASAADCQKLLEELKGHPHPGLRESAVNAILERWTHLDPAGAFASFEANDRLRNSVSRHWAHLDPGAALAATNGKYDNDIQQGIMETDPDHALSRWQEIAGDKPFPLPMLEYALKSQIKHDPAGAMNQTGTADDYQANQIRNKLFKTWVESDPDKAFKWAAENKNQRVKGELLATLAEKFPEKVAPLIAGMDDLSTNQMSVGVAKGKFASDPLEAARWLKENSSKGQFATLLDGAIPRQSTALSVETLGGILSMLQDPAWRDPILGRFSSCSPDAVKAYLRAQPVGGLSIQQQEMAFRSFPFETALELVPDPKLSSEMKRDLGRQWASQKPEEAAKQISALPSSIQSDLAASTLDSMGRRSSNGQFVIEQSAALFNSLAPAAQSQTALNFAWQQTQQPEVAAQTLSFLPNTESNAAAPAVYEKVATSWVEKDPLAASTWIKGLAPGAARDAAAVALISNQAAQDPQAAAAWAATLTDPVAVMQAQQILNTSNQP